MRRSGIVRKAIYRVGSLRSQGFSGEALSTRAHRSHAWLDGRMSAVGISKFRRWSSASCHVVEDRGADTSSKQDSNADAALSTMIDTDPLDVRRFRRSVHTYTVNSL